MFNSITGLYPLNASIDSSIKTTTTTKCFQALPKVSKEKTVERIQ
jgi:hypothetical protein